MMHGAVLPLPQTTPIFVMSPVQQSMSSKIMYATTKGCGRKGRGKRDSAGVVAGKAERVGGAFRQTCGDRGKKYFWVHRVRHTTGEENTYARSMQAASPQSSRLTNRRFRARAPFSRTPQEAIRQQESATPTHATSCYIEEHNNKSNERARECCFRRPSPPHQHATTTPRHKAGRRASSLSVRPTGFRPAGRQRNLCPRQYIPCEQQRAPPPAARRRGDATGGRGATAKLKPTETPSTAKQEAPPHETTNSFSQGWLPSLSSSPPPPPHPTAPCPLLPFPALPYPTLHHSTLSFPSLSPKSPMSPQPSPPQTPQASTQHTSPALDSTPSNPLEQAVLW